MAKILVVDDEIGIRELLCEILRDEGHDVVLAENAATAREARQAGRPDLVLLDIWMPDTDGVTLLKDWAASGMLTMPVIMMSGHGTIDTAVEAIRLGAMDFLEKPIALQKLLSAVKRGLQKQMPRTRSHLTLSAFSRSSALRDLRKRLDQVSQKSRLILLRVGPGAITELCARSLQAPGTPWLDLGTRSQPVEIQTLESARGGQVIVEDLALLTPLPAEEPRLRRRTLGKIRPAHAGGLLPHPRRTHCGQLGYSGREATVRSRAVPPSLLELRDDVPEMASQLLQHLIESGEVPHRSLSTAALNALRNCPWPGGFADLKSAIKSLALAALEEEIGSEEVVRFATRTTTAALALPLDMPLREARDTFERLYLEHHLQLEDGNITRLAEKTGLERTHLYRKLKQLGIPVGRKAE